MYPLFLADFPELVLLARPIVRTLETYLFQNLYRLHPTLRIPSVHAEKS